ncbi:tetratricopeptide repeat protein [Altererythrobacter sp.]|uniref:tetratricopeptide repeat protein n=1 Tax=Altererythrobacter sp. TaxID=1872480 RepID=UPI003D057F91
MSRTASKKNRIGPKVSLVVTTALASIALTGCTTNAAPRAETSISKAQVALTNGKADKAVTHAESAVLAEPRNAGYRALLGAAYLEAGRFQSAATAFSDALELGDSDPRTVLSYALAEAALGNNANAVSVLEQWEGNIDPADYGLAIALAGQPDRGVHVLSNALRAGENTPKVRQNLAYAYALQGNWRAARVMAAEDVPADQVNDRIGEWAELSRPEYFQYRVAALLQVDAAQDSGQPAQLALSNFPSQETMVAEAAAQVPADQSSEGDDPQFALVQPVEDNSGEVPFAPAPDSFDHAFAATEPSAAEPGKSRFVSNEVVQAIPAGYVEPQSKPRARSRIAARSSQRRMALAGDTHLVQLGSFSSRENAERAWGIYQKRFPQLSDHDLVITEAKVRGKTYYRVSANGFAANGARTMCGTVKASGNGCFAYAEGRPLPGAIDSAVRVASR